MNGPFSQKSIKPGELAEREGDWAPTSKIIRRVLLALLGRGAPSRLAGPLIVIPTFGFNLYRNVMVCGLPMGGLKGERDILLPSLCPHSHNHRTTSFLHPVTGKISPENTEYTLQDRWVPPPPLAGTSHALPHTQRSLQGQVVQRSHQEVARPIAGENLKTVERRYR